MMLRQAVACSLEPTYREYVNMANQSFRTRVGNLLTGKDKLLDGHNTFARQ